MDLISVIVPAYNAESTIDKCLQSILGGSYPSIELIVVNDGSTDNTKEIVSGWMAKDPRIKLINQENTGVGGARNTGIQSVTGDYVAWCDSDDWVEPDWLESLHRHIVEFDADIAICRCQIDGRASVNTGEVEIWDRDAATRLFLEHVQLNGSLYNKLFKKKVLDGGVFDTQLSYFEDDKFFWQTIKKAERLVRFHEEKYHLVYNPTSLTSRNCNDKRIRAVSVWEEIAADCIATTYEKLANGQMVYQYFVLLLAMFRGNCHDAGVEKKICAAMRRSFADGLRHVHGTSHKLFYGISAFVPRLSRTLFLMLLFRK